MPRVQFKGSMLNGALPGSSCAAHVSGWMNSGYSLIGWNISRRMFDKLLNPWLLMMDDHTSYVSIDGINFAKANGILLVTFPPHCGHKLQPLDSTIYGPLKKYSRILIMSSLPYSVKARTLSGLTFLWHWMRAKGLDNASPKHHVHHFTLVCEYWFTQAAAAVNNW